MRDDGTLIFLDVAQQTGVAEGVPGGKPRLYTIRFAREFDESEDVFGRATLWIAERLAVSVPQAVYIEAALGAGAAWGHTNAKTSERLIGLWAAIAGVVRARGIPCRRANVKTIRKFFVGQGNLPSDKAKREVMRICRCLGWEPANFDEADAAAGWLYAASLHDKTLLAPREHWTPRVED